MPNLDFASGVIGGYFNAARAERERREDAAKFAIDALIRSGRINHPDDLRPYFDLLGESSLFGSLRGGRAGGKGGGGQGPGKGKSDPYALIGAITGPIFKQSQQASQTQTQAQPQAQAQGPPAFPAPGAPAGPSGAAPGLVPSPGAAPAPPSPPSRGVFGSFPAMPSLLDDQQLLEREMTGLRAKGQVATETKRGETRMLGEEDQRQIAERTLDYKKADPTLSDLDARILAVEEVTGRRLTPTGGTQGYTAMQRGVAGSTLGPDVRTMQGLPLTDEERSDKATTWDVFQYRQAGRPPELRAMPSKPGREAPPGDPTSLTWAYEHEKDQGPTGAAARRIIEASKQKGALAGIRIETGRENLTGEETQALENAFAETFDGPFPKPETENKLRKEFDSRSPRAIFEAAVNQWATGQAPGLGFSRKQVVRSAVADIAGRIASITGISTIEAVASYGSTRRALQQFAPRAALVDQASDAFERNLKLAEDASTRVPRTSIRPLNRIWLDLVLNFRPAPELTEFETYIYTTVREAARVATQQTTGAGLTDYAQKKAETLLSQVMAGQSFTAAAQALKNDVEQVKASMVDERRRLLDDIHGIVPRPQPPGTTAPGPRAAPGPGGAPANPFRRG